MPRTLKLPFLAMPGPFSNAQHDENWVFWIFYSHAVKGRFPRIGVGGGAYLNNILMGLGIKKCPLLPQAPGGGGAKKGNVDQAHFLKNAPLFGSGLSAECANFPFFAHFGGPPPILH
jgi:hypothetical protein